ncbi:MAG: hypothetical protein MUF33_15520 [Candidatus Nanopelagicales bacterium]|nr:hypothetical protein [Candidatus Nanopelagicales bacterium]
MRALFTVYVTGIPYGGLPKSGCKWLSPMASRQATESGCNGNPLTGVFQ